jgi:hypothetical protein
MVVRNQNTSWTASNTFIALLFMLTTWPTIVVGQNGVPASNLVSQMLAAMGMRKGGIVADPLNNPFTVGKLADLAVYGKSCAVASDAFEAKLNAFVESMPPFWQEKSFAEIRWRFSQLKVSSSQQREGFCAAVKPLVEAIENMEVTE